MSTAGESETDLDDVFKALASPLRRRVLDLLRDGPRTTADLCASFPDVDRCTVMQHLGVLDRAGLLAVVRRGRERWNHLDVLPIQAIHDRWISHFAGSAVGMLGALRDELEADVGR
jgi:DNA-binding transcriptional ArsR family regulator